MKNRPTAEMIEELTGALLENDKPELVDLIPYLKSIEYTVNKVDVKSLREIKKELKLITDYGWLGLDFIDGSFIDLKVKMGVDMTYWLGGGYTIYGKTDGTEWSPEDYLKLKKLETFLK